MHGTSAYYGRERLLQTLRQYEYWDDLIDACKSGYIEPTAIPGEQGKVHLNLGVAYYCRGKRRSAAGDKELAEIRRLSESSRRPRKQRSTKAATRPKRNKAHGGGRSRSISAPMAELSRSSGKELESYRRIVEGFFLSRKMLLIVLGRAVRRRARRSSGSSAGRSSWPFSPSPLAIGGGVWLFQRHLALWNLPYDSKNVEFRLHVAEAARGGRSRRGRVVRPPVRRKTASTRCGRRPISWRSSTASARRTTPAKSSTSSASWPAWPISIRPRSRGSHRSPANSAFRPIGGCRENQQGARPAAARSPRWARSLWRPWPAPDWKLKDAEGHEHTLAEFRGKPLLMVFFLGEGCPHCMQAARSLRQEGRSKSKKRG